MSIDPQSPRSNISPSLPQTPENWTADPLSPLPGSSPMQAARSPYTSQPKVRPRDFDECKEGDKVDLFRTALGLDQPASRASRGESSRMTPRVNRDAFSITVVPMTPKEREFRKRIAAALFGDPEIASRCVLSQRTDPLREQIIPEQLNLPKYKTATVCERFTTDDPDYHLLAQSKNGYLVVSSGNDAWIKLMKERYTFQLKDIQISDSAYNSSMRPTSLAFDTENPSRLCVGTSIGTIDYWDLKNPYDPIRIASIELPDPQEINVVLFKHDSIFAGTKSGQLYQIIIANDEELFGKTIYLGRIFNGACQNLVATDNYLLATGMDLLENGIQSYTTQLFKFDLTKQSYLPVQIVEKRIANPLRAAGFSPNSQYFAIGTYKREEEEDVGIISIYKIEQGKASPYRSFTLDAPVTQLFWPRGNAIITTHEDGSIQSHSICFDSKNITSDPKNTIQAHQTPILYAAMSIDDQGLATFASGVPYEIESPYGQVHIMHFQAGKPAIPKKPPQSKIDEIVIR